jgi:hypothetical protein
MRGRDLARWGLVVASWGFVACIVAQVFLAGLGVFDSPRAFITHRDFGYAFGWLTVVMVVLAAIRGVSRRLLGLTALTIVLFTFQSLFVALRADYPQVAALHPVNGFALLLVAILIARLAWLERAAARLPEPGPAVAADQRSAST